MKKFCRWENIWDRLPPVFEELDVRAKGWKVVPLKSTADALPKPGRFSDPVIMSAWLADMRSVESCSSVRGKT